jgi:putative transposase
MRRSRFTKQQIVAALRQAESGTPVVEVCRKLGITEQTFYRWKRKFAGMGVADLPLDKQMLQETLRKNW